MGRTSSKKKKPLPRIKLHFSLTSKRAKEERHLKHQKLTNAITEARQHYLTEVDIIAEEHGR
jgi:hypothetical protein